jgi:hypothetical protein
MVPASYLKSGTILQIEKNLYQVLATEYHMGCGKMSSLQDECTNLQPSPMVCRFRSLSFSKSERV